MQRWSLRTAGAAGCLALALAGCGGGTPDAAPDAAAPADAPATTAPMVVPPPQPGRAAPEAQTVAVPAASDSAAPADLATSLDSLRAEIARLGATTIALAAAQDSVRAALRSADGAARDDAAAQTDTAAASSEEILREAGETAKSYGLRAFWAFLVLILAYYLIRASVYVLDTLAERSAERRLLFKRLVPIARVVLWKVAIVFVVRVIFDVDARGLLAAGAALGVAIGFAAQDILKNIFGGLVIIFDRPFQVGDKIQVGDSYGEVVGIGLRSTRIVTPDDSLVSVPNAQVVDGQVSNANTGALDCQVVTDLYLPGWADEAKAKRIALQAATTSKFVYLQKPVVVLVKDEFKETFILHLKVKAYVMDNRYEFAFMSDVTERARAEFRRQGLLGRQQGMRAYVDFSAVPNGEEDGAAAASRGGHG